MRHRLNDPNHWRTRSKAMRSSAEETDDPKAKAYMTGAAEAYENLAKEAERRSRPVTDAGQKVMAPSHYEI